MGSVNSCEDQHAVCNSQRACECDTGFYDNNGAVEFGTCIASKHFIFHCCRCAFEIHFSCIPDQGFCYFYQFERILSCTLDKDI